MHLWLWLEREIGFHIHLFADWYVGQEHLSILLEEASRIYLMQRVRNKAEGHPFSQRRTDVKEELLNLYKAAIAERRPLLQHCWRWARFSAIVVEEKLKKEPTEQRGRKSGFLRVD